MDGDADPRYKFTSKERDAETQYDYFGARYYDSWIGRWLSVDPMAEKYPGWSPYNYDLDNPMRFVDPDGADLSDFYDKNGNLVRHINDQSNAVYRQKGSKQDLHYEFAGYDESQGGKDVVNLKSAIQEAQKLNEANPYLQQGSDPAKPKQTYCNYATQDILQTIGSAYGEDINLTGLANDMAINIQKSPYFKEVGLKEAISNAAEGNLSLLMYYNPVGSGHGATFSVGENLFEGLIANIGPKPNTGYKSLSLTINSGRARKYYILKLSSLNH